MILIDRKLLRDAIREALWEDCKVNHDDVEFMVNFIERRIDEYRVMDYMPKEPRSG